MEVLPDEDELYRLRDEVERLAGEIARLAAEHQMQVSNLERAVASRDLIGQAKGIIMATLGCTAEEAFSTLTDRSQHQNRKLIDVASDVVTGVDAISSAAEAAE